MALDPNTTIKHWPQSWNKLYETYRKKVNKDTLYSLGCIFDVALGNISRIPLYRSSGIDFDRLVITNEVYHLDPAPYPALEGNIIHVAAQTQNHPMITAVINCVKEKKILLGKKDGLGLTAQRLCEMCDYNEPSSKIAESTSTSAKAPIHMGGSSIISRTPLTNTPPPKTTIPAAESTVPPPPLTTTITAAPSTPPTSTIIMPPITMLPPSFYATATSTTTPAASSKTTSPPPATTTNFPPLYRPEIIHGSRVWQESITIMPPSTAAAAFISTSTTAAAAAPSTIVSAAPTIDVNWHPNLISEPIIKGYTVWICCFHPSKDYVYWAGFDTVNNKGIALQAPFGINVPPTEIKGGWCSISGPQFYFKKDGKFLFGLRFEKEELIPKIEDQISSCHMYGEEYKPYLSGNIYGFFDHKTCKG